MNIKTLFNFLLLPFNFKLWSCLLILTFNHSVLTIAQNLVPNPSFEDYTECPYTYYMLPNDWYTCSADPDYFNACDTGNFSVPNANFGYQEAADGNAYCGFYSLSFTAFKPYKEYLGCQLISPLIIGQKYYISFKVNFTGGGGICMATNNIGLLFSTVSFQDNDPYDTIWGIPTTNFAHVNDTSIISDSQNWTNISGTIIADSAYQYILIGNFFDVQHTDTLVWSSELAQKKAYYYLDDVCVSEDSATCFTNTSLKEGIKINTKINVIPNPFSYQTAVFLNYSEQIDKIKIYDITGKDVTSNTIITNFKKENNSLKFIIHKNNLSEGIYFLKISSCNFIYSTKLIITN